MIIQARLAEVRSAELRRGSHSAIDSGMCVMEAVAYVAGEPWSDRPQCASSTIASFLRAWNDSLPDDETRTLLLAPLIGRLVGTAASTEIEERRSYLALNWMIRVMTPTWLDLAGLTGCAAALRDLVEITDIESASAAVDAAVDAARVSARVSAVDAARVSAWDAARAAAVDAAWVAARAAAWDAARAAAVDAAWVAARVAAWDAARAAAVDAARAAAVDAARAAAVVAARAAAVDAARAAAVDAAVDALAPTIVKLQSSALDLVDRMIDLGGAK